MTSDGRRMLFISYAYPPTGGGGVQRSVKFTKYLPAFGWRPTVLTAANPSVPVRDSDLADDLDPTMTILQAKTLEPSYSIKKKLVSSGMPSRFSPTRWVRRAAMSLLQPDPQVLWSPFAYRMAKAALAKTRHDAIYVTGPPFSSFLLGRKLKRRFGLPLVLDFRDEWLLASQYMDNHQRSGFAYRRQLAMLGRVLRVADAIVATTQASAAELARYVKNTGSQASVHCIYNGFDEDDFVRVRPSECKPDRLRIVYTGTLWELTDVSPVVSALLLVASIDPKAASHIDLVLAGRRTPQQDMILKRLEGTPIHLEFHDYLPHQQSLNLAASADALLLLLADKPGAERVVPAKMFEYLALRKPILTVCGDGETATIMHSHGQPDVFHPDRPEEIANRILLQIRESTLDISQPESTSPWSIPDQAIAQFSRRRLTGELASIMTSVSTAR